MSKILLAALVAASLQGCAYINKDPRDAAWDPPQGRQLFEQIPAWDDRAQRVCCGHLRQCQPHQTPRC